MAGVAAVPAVPAPYLTVENQVFFHQNWEFDSKSIWIYTHISIYIYIIHTCMHMCIYIYLFICVCVILSYFICLFLKSIRVPRTGLPRKGD